MIRMMLAVRGCARARSVLIVAAGRLWQLTKIGFDAIAQPDLLEMFAFWNEYMLCW